MLVACSSTSGPTGVTPAPASPALEAREAEPPAAVLRSIRAANLVEGASSRDPSRAYPSEPPSPPDDGALARRRIPVDQLRVVGLVTGGPSPRAILVDPSGRGHIVGPGDLVGRPEPASGDRVASFRVDRIRDGAVSLVREGGSDGRTVDAAGVLSLPQTPRLEADD